MFFKSFGILLCDNILVTNNLEMEDVLCKMLPRWYNSIVRLCQPKWLCQRTRQDLISHHFHLVTMETLIIERQQQWECDPILGFRSFHSISLVCTTNPMKLMVQYYSYYCAFCQARLWDQYENAAHVFVWMCIKIYNRNARQARHIIEDSIEDVDNSQFVGYDIPLVRHIAIGQISQFGLKKIILRKFSITY